MNFDLETSERICCIASVHAERWFWNCGPRNTRTSKIICNHPQTAFPKKHF